MGSSHLASSQDLNLLEAALGAWPVPSPQALGWFSPVSPFHAALQISTTMPFTWLACVLCDKLIQSFLTFR